MSDRIAQFQNMAQADPENEMAHFSLAGELMKAERWAEAAESYMRCTEIVPGMSKAYQLAGECYLKLGQTERAGQVLTRGYVIAAERGDVMPRDAIAKALEGMGREVPRVDSTPATEGGGDISLLGGGGGLERYEGEIPEGAFVCQRTGRPGTQMDRPPFKGPVGEWIHANITKETFDLWIAQGTKVINELRLDLSNEGDEATYDRHMREYLGIDDALYEQLMKGS